MAGAALAFVAVAALHALTVPTFAPPDEASHVGYAVLVGQGRLPTIDTPIPEAEMPRVDRTLGARDAQRQDIWTANHPPLFYVLAAGPVRVGLMSAPSLAGIRAARLLPIALAALGIVLVALLALELAPGRPQVAVAAAGLTALLPSFVHNSSILYNDALAFLTSTATLLVAVIVVLRGPSAARLAALALTASATALTRSSGLLVAATAVAAALVASWLHERPAGARLALRRAGLVAAAVVAACGWFYARNLLLYGDLTGAEALLAKFDRSPGGSVASCCVPVPSGSTSSSACGTTACTCTAGGAGPAPTTPRCSRWSRWPGSRSPAGRGCGAGRRRPPGRAWRPGRSGWSRAWSCPWSSL